MDDQSTPDAAQPIRFVDHDPAPFRDRLTGLGLVFRAENPDRTKRYFREAPGRPRTHLHVRRAGSFSEQVNLLFRDFLRADDWAGRRGWEPGPSDA